MRGANFLTAQHITAQGTIAPGWDPEGRRLSPTPGFQEYVASAATSDMEMIVAWEDGRAGDGNPLGTDIYAQRVGGDFPTPTLFALVSALAEPGSVALRWQASLGAPSTVQVERRDEHANWKLLGLAHLQGDLLVFEDRTVVAGRYAYRLRVDDAASAETWVTVPSSYTLALVGFSPNPTNRVPSVSFSLANRDPATLHVFDVSGRAVFSREVSALGPGSHRVTIDGSSLTAGVYWVRLVQQDRSLAAKGLIIR